MDFEKLSAERYSLRKFDTRPVEQEKLDLILEAGRNAPTAHNNQPQRIFVFRSPEALEKADACMDCHFHAPVVIAVGYDPKECYTGRSPLEAASIGIPLKDTDVTARANLVTLSGEGEYEALTMEDYSAGEISTEEEGSLRRTQLSGLVELLRSSLEISEKLSITLREELRFVRTYLNLQTQALGPDFHLAWNIDPSLDTDAIYLPAMLIQIPVENAVKHGLCAIEGEKRLSVFVERDGKGIHIRIEDNGPGYRPFTNAGHTNGTGMGTKVLYRTILLLNRRNKEKITYSVQSKEKGMGSGTIVSFFIPLDFNYAF